MKPLDALRELGEGAAPPTAAKARVYGLVLAGLQAATSPAAPHPSPVAPVTATPAAGLPALLGRKLLAYGVGLTLAAGVSGAAIYAAVRPPSLKIVYVDRPAPVVTAPSVVSSSAAAPAVPSVAPAITARAKPASSVRTHPRWGLARERELLDRAQKSAAGGDTDKALEAVAAHRAEFPAGQLAEEREALAVQVLAKAGRNAEAAALAESFHARYPRSFLSEVVDATVAKP
jgi:hypothetical protein